MSEKLVCKICGKKVNPNWMKRHVELYHNLSGYEYYVKYINSEPVPNCPICGTKVPWANVVIGYRKTCGNENCIGKNRSQQLKSLGDEHPFHKIALDPEVRLERSANARIQKKQNRNGLVNYNYNDYRKRNMMSYINKYGLKEGFLYLIVVDNYLKIGITTDFDRRMWGFTTYNLIKLIKLNTVCCAQLERYILEKYDSETINYRNSTEYLPLELKDDLIRLLENFENSKVLD